MRRIPAILSFLCATAALGAAQELYVGSSNTVFLRGDPLDGGFVVLGACGGSIRSLGEDHGDLWLGASGGIVYRYRPEIGFASYAFDAPNDAEALLVRGGALWLGGGDGVVHEVDKRDGALLRSFPAGVPITAMLVQDGFLYVGSSFGVVLRMPEEGGSFSFWGTCGGPVSSMAADETHLILGDASGTVYRLAFATQQIETSFSLASDATAMALHEHVLLVAGSSGEVLRVDRHDGSLLGSVFATPGIEALVLGASAEPGTPYCYGIACPCANDDVLGGCGNHLGRGARTQASGTASAAVDDLVLVTSDLPPNGWGVPYMGSQLAEVPFGDGLLCTGGGYPVFRFPARNAGASGVITLGPGLVGHSQTHFVAQGGAIAPGTSWVFQVWYRNPAGPCGAGFNTANGYVVSFGP